MPTGFTVFGELSIATAKAEAQIRGSFSKLETANKASLKRIDAIEKRNARERKKRSKARRKAVRSGATAIGGGVVAAAVSGIRDTLAFQETLDGVAIQAGASAEKMAVFERALTATSRKTAISRQELALAAETLTNLLGPAAIENADLLDLVARTAVATGADVSELGGLISAVSDTMAIAVTDTVNMEKALSAFVRTGKEGKIPLSEMAAVLQDVSGTFKRVGAGGVQSAADVSAALQVLRKQTGSAAKAGTVLEAGINSLVQKSAEFKKAGIKVFIGKGPEKRLRGMRDILDQIASKKLNIKQLQDILGRKEAVRFFELLGDPKARAEFDALSRSGVNATDIMTDLGKKTETQGFRIKKAMNDAKLAIADAMTPERIEAGVKALTGFAEVAGTIVDGFEEAGTFIGETAAKIDEDLGLTDTTRDRRFSEGELTPMAFGSELGSRLGDKEADRRFLERSGTSSPKELKAFLRSEGKKRSATARAESAFTAAVDDISDLAAGAGPVSAQEIADALEERGVVLPAAAPDSGPLGVVSNALRDTAILEALNRINSTLESDDVQRVQLDPDALRSLERRSSFIGPQRPPPTLDPGTR